VRGIAIRKIGGEFGKGRVERELPFQARLPVFYERFSKRRRETVLPKIVAIRVRGVVESSCWT